MWFCRETSNYTLIKLKLNSNQGTRGVCVFTSRRLLCSVSWRFPTMASCATTTTIAPVIQPIMEQSPSTAVLYCHSDAFELVLVCRSTDTNTTKSKQEVGSNVSDSFLAILVCWWNLAFHLECFVNRYSQASVFFSVQLFVYINVSSSLQDGGEKLLRTVEGRKDSTRPVARYTWNVILFRLYVIKIITIIHFPEGEPESVCRRLLCYCSVQINHRHPRRRVRSRPGNHRSKPWWQRKPRLGKIYGD